MLFLHFCDFQSLQDSDASNALDELDISREDTTFWLTTLMTTEKNVVPSKQRQFIQTVVSSGLIFKHV